MRFHQNINQVKCIEWGLNFSQGALFDLLNQMHSWAKPHVISEEVYYWVSRNKVIDEIPLAYDKPDTVYRAFKTLSEKGLIVYKKEGQKDLIQLTEKGKTWNAKITEKDMKNHSETNPNDEKFCPKLGNKSEETRKYIRKNSEMNPTYKNTNNKNYKNNNKKNKQKKESLKTFKPQKPESVNDQIWNDLVSHRQSKKCSDTQTAWHVIFSQLTQTQKATGHSLNTIISEWIANDWKGFKAQWYINSQQQNTQRTGNRHANNQSANTKPSEAEHFEKLREQIRSRNQSSQPNQTMRTVN